MSRADKPASEMTIREYAAIKIAAGMVANSIPGGHHLVERIAAAATAQADCLLAELEQSREGK